MAKDHLIISCDSHIVEVPEIFEGLSERFGDEAPGNLPDIESNWAFYAIFCVPLSFDKQSGLALTRTNASVSRTAGKLITSFHLPSPPSSDCRLVWWAPRRNDFVDTCRNAPFLKRWIRWAYNFVVRLARNLQDRKF